MPNVVVVAVVEVIIIIIINDNNNNNSCNRKVQIQTSVILTPMAEYYVLIMYHHKQLRYMSILGEG